MAVGNAPDQDSPARDRRYRAPDRETILDVAAEMFERHGYRSTTMQDLAEQLNISKATLYAHANSKTDVLVGILEQWTRLVGQDLDEAVQHPSPADRVRILLRLWTRPDGRALGLYQAGDAAQMQAILEALPLGPWMTVDTTPLSPHPSDPAIIHPPTTAPAGTP